MKTVTLIVFIGLFAKSTLCFSWGAKGHKIVVEIAKVYLEKNVKDSVQKYLGGMSFQDAACWMEAVKNDKYYDYLIPLHYINIEKDKTYVRSTGNIVSELEFVIAQLKNKNRVCKEDVKMALKVLFHLIGDLHQPLHVGYGKDKGGCMVPVQCYGKRTDINQVWEYDIIETKCIAAEDCIKIIECYSSKEIQDIQNIDVITWMNTSRKLLPEVYGFKANNIDEAYITKTTLIIEKQLAIAGLRLASVLNTYFK